MRRFLAMIRTAVGTWNGNHRPAVGSVILIKKLMWWGGNIKEHLFKQVAFTLGAVALQGALVGPRKRN